jgi:hypothetical protein
MAFLLGLRLHEPRVLLQVFSNDKLFLKLFQNESPRDSLEAYLDRIKGTMGLGKQIILEGERDMIQFLEHWDEWTLDWDSLVKHRALDVMTDSKWDLPRLFNTLAHHRDGLLNRPEMQSLEHSLDFIPRVPPRL